MILGAFCCGTDPFLSSIVIFLWCGFEKNITFARKLSIPLKGLVTRQTHYN